ncbi:MAG: hypothetical protein SGBAC_005453 [Bacillariaceae sp.]
MTKKRSNSQNEEDQDFNSRNVIIGDDDEMGEDVLATLRLVDTTDQALELIDSLSNQQQRFEGEDPGDLFDQMDEMRQNLQSAWKDVLVEENNPNKPNNSNQGSTSDDDKVEDSSSKRGRDGRAQDSNSNSNSSSSSNNMTEEEYRSSYVETMTKVLSEPLDAIREQQQQQQPSNSGNKGGLDIDVELIVDALQSGIDLLHPEEKMIFLEELQAMEEADETDTTTTKGELSIHMMHRKELGYDA